LPSRPERRFSREEAALEAIEIESHLRGLTDGELAGLAAGELTEAGREALRREEARRRTPEYARELEAADG
jgi:hypothetical protein